MHALLKVYVSTNGYRSLHKPMFRECNPEYQLKNGPLLEKVMSETPKYGLYLFLNYRPFKPLLNYQHCRLWRSFVY